MVIKVAGPIKKKDTPLIRNPDTMKPLAPFTRHNIQSRHRFRMSGCKTYKFVSQSTKYSCKDHVHCWCTDEHQPNLQLIQTKLRNNSFRASISLKPGGKCKKSVTALKGFAVFIFLPERCLKDIGLFSYMAKWPSLVCIYRIREVQF